MPRMVLTYVNGKIKDDRSFKCGVCHKEYDSLKDLWTVYSSGGYKRHVCVACGQKE